MLSLTGKHIVKENMTYDEACILLDKVNTSEAGKFLCFFLIGEANKTMWTLVSMPLEYVNNPHNFYIEE